MRGERQHFGKDLAGDFLPGLVQQMEPDVIPRLQVTFKIHQGFGEGKVTDLGWIHGTGDHFVLNAIKTDRQWLGEKEQGSVDFRQSHLERSMHGSNIIKVHRLGNTFHLDLDGVTDLH